MVVCWGEGWDEGRCSESQAAVPLCLHDPKTTRRGGLPHPKYTLQTRPHGPAGPRAGERQTPMAHNEPFRQPRQGREAEATQGTLPGLLGYGWMRLPPHKFPWDVLPGLCTTPNLQTRASGPRLERYIETPKRSSSSSLTGYWGPPGPPMDCQGLAWAEARMIALLTTTAA